MTLPLQRRLERLCQALEPLPDAVRRPPEDRAAGLLAGIDDIAGRVRSLAALLEEEVDDGWDAVSHVAAQMLLRDLAVIARDLRATAAVVADDLAASAETLRRTHAETAQLLDQIERESQRAAAGVMPDGS